MLVLTPAVTCDDPQKDGPLMPHSRLRLRLRLQLRLPRRLRPLCLLFVAVLAGCSAPSGRMQPTATIVAAPPARLAGGAWERISLPAPSDQMRGFAVAPRDPATLFACTAALPPPVPAAPAAPANPLQAATPQPVALWRST